MTVPATSYLRIEKSGDVIIDVHVVPNSKTTAIDGLHDGALRVRLHAPPVDGKANQALVTWLADALGLARADVEIARGESSRRKQLRVRAGVTGRASWDALRPAE